MNQIVDWNDAYSNGAYIPDGAGFPDRWLQQATQYQESTLCELNISYGESSREAYDLFLPPAKPAGLFVFVHGGYWVQFDKSYWSQFAKGFVDAGWAVALPSYELCPHTTIANIEIQIAHAIDAAAKKIAGPIILGGHSAGGQLVSSMVCHDTRLSAPTLERVVHVLSISGVHDLRPLLNTDLNEQLKLDMHSAVLSSPALKVPHPNTRLTALVGADERPEFVRQNALLANIWLGLGASVRTIEAPGRHHFNIIDLLLDNSAMVSELINGD